MDVRSVLLLPDLRPVSGAELLTLALVWDMIVCLDYPAAADALATDEMTSGIASALEENGVLRREDTLDPALPAKPSYPRSLSDLVSERDMHDVMAWMVDVHLGCARDALTIARDRGLPPLAVGSFGVVASAASEPRGHVSIAEGTLVTASVKGIALSRDTPVDEVLAFRERHCNELGRLRGALVDLSASMTREASARAMAEEALAVIRNRVGPELAALGTRLKEGRIAFALRTIAGASGVGSGHLIPKSTAEIVVSALRYRWHRRQLVSEHPYGYLHQLSGFEHLDRADVPSVFTGTHAFRDEAEVRRFFIDIGLEAHHQAATRLRGAAPERSDPER